MWDAGLAHRDIKPANVMIRDGGVVLIDVAFGTVRPSPWRQAVDLANMMVILALRTDPKLVYERALLQFAPEDIAEAFAATRSVTLPSQSRSSLALFKKETGVDLVEEFRKLAPHTEPISIQRWSYRRIALTVAAVFLAMLGLSLIVSEITGGGLL
jgi:serine/threonine protein kinase